MSRIIGAMTGVGAAAQDVLPVAPSTEHARASCWVAFVLAVLVFAGLSLTAGRMSDGFLEADVCILPGEDPAELGAEGAGGSGWAGHPPKLAPSLGGGNEEGHRAP